MTYGNDDFMNFMGYRNSILEEKIEQCLAAARRGESTVSIDADGLTDCEIEYIKKEVSRRLGNG